MFAVGRVHEVFVSREPAHSKTCLRYSSLPEGPDAFASIQNQGVPVAFENSLELFGARVAAWRNTAELLRRHGDQMVHASYFDTQRAGEKFGVYVDHSGNETVLSLPAHKRLPLKEVLTMNETGRLAYLEQHALYRSSGDRPQFSGDRFQREGRNAPSPLWDWVAPKFRDWTRAHPGGRRGDTVINMINLWGGKIDPNITKQSATHFDAYDNLMLMLRGTKRFYMYSANDIAAMYPQHLTSTRSSDPDSRIVKGDGELGTKDNFSPVSG